MTGESSSQMAMAVATGLSITTAAPRRFRYSYLCRLIDDRELQDLAPAVRAELRKAHKEAYWKNVSLLRRDANRVLRLRRERMSASQQWDFASLVNDHARVQYLLATLTLAGIGHATRISVGLEQVRTACCELEKMFTVPSFAPATA
jgi:hypothetical protein